PHRSSFQPAASGFDAVTASWVLHYTDDPHVLADFWHAHHPDNPAMRASLEQDLLAHYGTGHQVVDDGAVLLTARQP
ncbi:hypothetical protein, partial [Streptomyces sp. NPDC058157]|uniref:hypothetical protein n=1 Tax=Streptomyces sp. NPDC058157 TaxID=3346360 RepID=UPI0036EAC554